MEDAPLAEVLSDVVDLTGVDFDELAATLAGRADASPALTRSLRRFLAEAKDPEAPIARFQDSL